jgi:biopolymer transport protein ExbD
MNADEESVSSCWLRAVFDERADKTLFITAARTLRYGDVVDVIDAAKGAGVQRGGIITERSIESSEPYA